MDLPQTLLVCLRNVRDDDPLGRLPYEQEQQLVSRGLIRHWEDFIAVTELGWAVLDNED